MSFAGVWRLIHTEATDANATPSNASYGGDQAMGLISFSGDGRMVCVLCCPALPSNNGTPSVLCGRPI